MSAWPDFSRGHTPAKKGDHSSYRHDLYHNRCGTKITVSTRVHGKTCDRCNEHWRYTVIDAFTDDQMAVRFHIRVEPDRGQYVIVWKTDEGSKRRYSTVVPISEAGDHERFKL